jgi:hypothetical protein
LELIKFFSRIVASIICLQFIIALLAGDFQMFIIGLILYGPFVVFIFLFDITKKKITLVKEKKYLIYIYILISCLTIYELSSIEQIGTLSILQGIPNLGLVFKSVTVFLPSLTWLLIKNGLSRKRWLYLLIYSIIAIYASTIILSKAIILPLGLLFLYSLKSKRIAIVVVIPFILLVLALMYESRGSSFNELPRLILYRFPGFNEMKVIFEYLFVEGNLIYDWWNIAGDNTVRITEKVFKFTSFKIGIAPGLFGFYILYFSVFAFPLFMLTSLFYRSYMQSLKNSSFLGLVLESIWTFELLSFVIDGVPHFIYSTSGALLFKLLFIISTLLIILKLCYPKKKKYIL